MTTNQQWIFNQDQRGSGLWTVGFYDPDGKWTPESDHESAREAGDRVHYLNGGSAEPMTVSRYSTAQVVEFFQRVNCMEETDLVDFLTWVNDGTTPHKSYIEGKWKSLQSNPGMFICILDTERAEKFMAWTLRV